MRIFVSALFCFVWGLFFAGSRPADPPPATDSVMTEVAAEMEALSDLEQYVTAHAATMDEVTARRPDLLKGLTLNSATNPVQVLQQQDDPLGIPSFLWGCVLGWVGIILVYVLTDKDEAEAKKALKGCVISYVVGTAVSLIAFALVIALEYQ